MLDNINLPREKRNRIPMELLYLLVRLDRLTGRLYWLERSPEMFQSGKHTAERICGRWNTMFAGKEALNSINAKGYATGEILGVKLRAHRVVFALHNGHWPAAEIDHKSGARSENKPDNLREATGSENSQNKAYPCGITGFRGLSLLRKSGRFRARIMAEGRHLSLGTFDTPELAAKAYDNAAKKLHGDFAFSQRAPL